MYGYLIGLEFDEVIKKLNEQNIRYDFGEDLSYEDVLKMLHERKEDDELSFEEVYIYIGGYWNDNRYDVYFRDDFKVEQISKFEGWE